MLHYMMSDISFVLFCAGPSENAYWVHMVWVARQVSDGNSEWD